MTCLKLAQWHQWFRWEVWTTLEKNEFREQAERKRLGAKDVFGKTIHQDSTVLRKPLTYIHQLGTWSTWLRMLGVLILLYQCSTPMLLVHSCCVCSFKERQLTQIWQNWSLISLKLDPDEHSHILRSVDTKKWTQKLICIRWTRVSTCKLVSWMLENGGLNMKGKI